MYYCRKEDEEATSTADRRLFGGGNSIYAPLPPQVGRFYAADIKKGGCYIGNTNVPGSKLI